LSVKAGIGWIVLIIGMELRRKRHDIRKPSYYKS